MGESLPLLGSLQRSSLDNALNSVQRLIQNNILMLTGLMAQQDLCHSVKGDLVKKEEIAMPLLRLDWAIIFPS